LESKELIFPLILGLIAININTTVLALGIEEYMFSILSVDGFAVLLLLWSSISFVESLFELLEVGKFWGFGSDGEDGESEEEED
jgi:hypothetical protein